MRPTIEELCSGRPWPRPVFSTRSSSVRSSMNTLPAAVIIGNRFIRCFVSWPGIAITPRRIAQPNEGEPEVTVRDVSPLRAACGWAASFAVIAPLITSWYGPRIPSQIWRICGTIGIGRPCSICMERRAPDCFESRARRGPSGHERTGVDLLIGRSRLGRARLGTVSEAWAQWSHFISGLMVNRRAQSPPTWTFLEMEII